MRFPNYRDPKRNRAVRLPARISWIYAAVISPVALLSMVGSPYVALDFGYLPAILTPTALASVGLVLGFAGLRELDASEDNSFVVNTRRESYWGLRISTVLLACSLLSILVLKGRVADLQDNRDSAAMGEAHLRMIFLARAFEGYTEESGGRGPPSVAALLERHLVQPKDIAKRPGDIALLERVAEGDKTVGSAEIERATGLRFLGGTSDIRAKQGDHSKDSVIAFATRRGPAGKVVVAWSDGTTGEVDPSSLTKPLPLK